MTQLAPEASLAQRLVQSHSPSGRESPAAKVFAAALKDLNFDEVTIDKAGNVIGAFRRGAGPTLMFNGHLDTVPLGDESLWPQPPLSGAVADGRLWGRGACDMKSALACMAYGARDAADAGFQGTLLVTAVVQEEVGGLGARHLAEHYRPDIVVLGEPSKLRLMLGHRGRVELEVTVPGRIAHAAKSELGDNALYHAADLLKKLQALELPRGGPLGGSSLTPTQLTSYPRDGANVVPGEVRLTIDYRNIPGDEDEILDRLEALMPEATFAIPVENSSSENGEVHYSFAQAAPPYLAPGENAYVNRARQVLRRVLGEAGHPFDEGCWWFCTDAPHLAATGAVVLGLGPGEEELAHTTEESIPLEHLPLARRAYAALAREFLGIEDKVGRELD